MVGIGILGITEQLLLLHLRSPSDFIHHVLIHWNREETQLHSTVGPKICVVWACWHWVKG